MTSGSARIQGAAGDDRTSKGLFKASLTYVIANGLNAGAAFLLIPILTRYLSPDAYGLVIMFALFATFTTPFVGLNAHGAMARRYFDLSRPEFETYAGNCILVLVCSSTIVLLLTWLIGDYIEAFVGLPVFWQLGAVVFCVGQYFGTLLLTRWQVLEKPFHYGSYMLALTLLNVALTLCFVVVLQQGWQGRVAAQIAASLALGLGGIVLMTAKSAIRLAFNAQYIRNALRFGLPLVPHAIAAILLAMADRLIITAVDGLTEAGRYAVAFQFASVLNILTAAVNSAFVPWLFGKLRTATPAARSEIVRTTYVYFAGLAVVGAGMAVTFVFAFPWLVGSEYRGMEGVMVWLIAASVFGGMYLMTSNYIFYAEKTHLLTFVTVAALVVHLPLCYAFTIWRGAMGAAQANCVAHAFSFLLTWWLSSRVVPMPWKPRQASAVPR